MTEATTSTSDGSAAVRSASPHRVRALPTVGATTPVHPTPLDRAVRLAVGALGHLPEPVLRAVAGAPVVRDDQHLETEVQAGLRVLSALPEESFEELPLVQGRRQIDIEAWQFGGRPAPIGLMQDLLIPGADGPIPARLYRPLGSPGTVGGSSGSSRRSSSGSRESARPVPLAVYYHGGGFVLGSITSHDPICRFLAHRAGVAVLSIGYRLAPEHPFPAGHEDAIAAYAWAAAHTETLGLAPHLAVVGDSAGGNLAAAVSLAARDRGLPMPAGQVLISPWLDLTSSAPSRTQFAKGFFLTTAQLDWYADHLLPDPDLATDPRVSPLRAPDLSGLPPTVLSFAGFDPLRDDSLAAAARLGEAGVPMTTHLQEGHIHAFSNVLGVGRTGRRAAGEIAEMLAGLLAER